MSGQRSPDRPEPSTGPERFDLLRSPIEDGITLVEASAGTGKTYCLTGLVLRLLLEQRVEHVGQLLVVTFTNAATEELVGRIRQGLRQALDALSAPPPAEPEEGVADDLFAHLARHHRPQGVAILRRALLDFDDLSVTTIHGFCKQALDESAFESGLPFEVEFLESDEEILAESARDVWRRLVALPEARSATLAEALSELGLGPESFVQDYREWSRYPETVILPEPPDLATAAQALEGARRELAESFDKARARRLLSGVTWKSGKRSGRELGDATRLDTVLSAVDDFLRDGAGQGEGNGGGGLWALRLLDPDVLRQEAYKKDLEAIDALPGLDALEAFHAAFGRIEHAVRGRFLHELATAFPLAKARAAHLAFDDLLHQLRDALADPRRGDRLRRAIRLRYSVALIDEFQDTDLVQFEIFERLFGDGPLFLVGDPKQAIYRFRGADIHAYLKAKRSADRAHTLGHNWRSGRRLVQSVNRVFGRGRRPFVFEDIPFLPVDSAAPVAERRIEGDGIPAVEWWWLGEISSVAKAESFLYQAVAEEVVRLLGGSAHLVDGDGKQRPLRPGDLAVLVRSNKQATKMQQALRQVGIPAVIGRSGDIFHSEEMTELCTLLRALVEPGRISRLRAACATLIWGDGAAELDEAGADDLRFQERVDAFEHYRDTWERRGFVATLEQLTSDRRVRPRWLGLEQGERRLTNLFHAVEVCHRAIHDHRLSPAGLVAWLDAERRLPRHDRDAAELRLESDALAVDLATVHKSKGLEYEVVFCPFLWKAREVSEPPLLAHLDADRVVYDCGSEALDQHLALAEAERLAEDLRLTYVALTRARRRCYVAWGEIGRGKTSAASALGYLLHRPSVVGAGGDDGDEGESVEATLRAIRARSRHWLDDLRALTDDPAEPMGLRRLDEGAESAPGPEPRLGPPVESEEPDEPEPEETRADEAPSSPLVARQLSSEARRQLRTWRISSYSSLSREDDAHVSGGRSGGGGELGVGADEASPARELERELPDREDPSSPSRDDRPLAPPAAETPTSPEGAEPPARGIFAFARGARAGDCLHQVFEDIDFPRAREPQARAVVKEKLRRFDLLEPGGHARGGIVPEGLEPLETAWEMVQNVLDAPLPGETFHLGAVPRAHRLVEWQFYTPLRPLAPTDLAQLIREHGHEDWRDTYAGRLERLRTHDVRGYLTGFVDLVFEHGGRWFVVDWKSNHLGDRASDYDVPAMTHAMVDHHYLLQYHLYVAALHRYLDARLPDWDYQQGFGGVFYVFLRGVEPPPSPSLAPPAPIPASMPKKGRGRSKHHQGQLDLFAQASPAAPQTTSEPGGPINGIFHDRPSWPLVRALADRLFGAVDEGHGDEGGFRP